jgi:O-antigen/teichoic acid export membrane protein
LVFYGLSIIFSSGLYVTGKTGHLASVVMASATLNVLLNLILIPRMGKEGAAIATMVTNAVMALTILSIARRSYHIPYRLSRTLAGIGIAVGGVALAGSWAGLGPAADLGLRVAATVAFTPALFATLGMKRGDVRAGIATLMSIIRRDASAPGSASLDI